jgi:hypothetical protein
MRFSDNRESAIGAKIPGGRFLFLGLALLLSLPICAAESGKLLRFEFQEHSGEGQFDLYRVKVDLAGQEGQFCYMNTYLDGVPDDIIGEFHVKQFSEIIDMDEFNPSCFDFVLYSFAGKPRGFHSPPVKREATYRFFYVGEISEEKMEGTLYDFRDFTPEPGEAYRNVNPIRVSVSPLKNRVAK